MPVDTLNTAEAAAGISKTIIITQQQKPQWRLRRKQQQRQLNLQQTKQLLLLSLIVFIGIIIIAPIGCDAVPLTSGDQHSVEFKRYCSSTLSEAIRLICGGRYYSLGRKFPDSIGHGSMRSLKSFTSDDGETYYRPLTSGPIHECCKRPCGYSELKLYCASED